MAENSVPVRYSAMCAAIEAVHRVDEAKGLRDQAAALAFYMRQAGNKEAERQCCEIRLRAERKAGELLKQMEKAKGAPGNQHTGPLERNEGSKTLSDLGISYDQSALWQKLAAVPIKQFELSLRRWTHPARLPSAHAIVAEAEHATWKAEQAAAGITPEQARREREKLFGLPPGVEACFWKNVAHMDPVTGNRPNTPVPAAEELAAAEQVLSEFLARFDVPGLSRVTRLIREAQAVLGYMQAGDIRH